MSFAAVNVVRPSGVTLSCSIVPISFSRTTFMAVSSAPILVTSITRMPGIM
jgi:hypothetical protein